MSSRVSRMVRITCTYRASLTVVRPALVAGISNFLAMNCSATSFLNERTSLGLLL